MDVMSRPLQLTGWRLLIGPPDLSEPTPSWAVDSLPRYEPEEVASTILAIPNCALASPAAPGWENWAARWQVDERVIEFNQAEVLCFDEDAAPRWCGCDLEADCRVGDLLVVWAEIHRRHPGVWLSDPNSWYQTMASFLRRFEPTEQGAAAERPPE
jgi:hypothetical protein